jgi:hypothetical protein
LSDVARQLIALLVEQDVVTDDRNVVDVYARWDRTIASGTVRVIAKQTTPPAERLDAETRRRCAAINRKPVPAERAVA